jgi:hypothetical protein
MEPPASGVGGGSPVSSPTVTIDRTQEFRLGILRQITPAQLAEIERRLEAVGDRGLEAPGKSAATFDTSGIPDGTMIECVPMFVDVIAAHIRSDGETLNEVGRRRQKQQLITLGFGLVHMRPDGIAD